MRRQNSCDTAEFAIRVCLLARACQNRTSMLAESAAVGGRAHALYAAYYEARPFVDVLSTGVPDLRRVVGSNTAAVGLHVQNGALVVDLTLDNLIKGGSGQALQSMNLAAGLPEALGLPRTGLGAV